MILTGIYNGRVTSVWEGDAGYQVGYKDDMGTGTIFVGKDEVPPGSSVLDWKGKDISADRDRAGFIKKIAIGERLVISRP